MKTYRLIGHTADISIRVKGSNLKSLFKNAALAVFDIMAARRNSGALPKKKLRISQDAQTREELLINWLNELLFLSAAKGLIFTGFKIDNLTDYRIEAMAVAEDINNYKVNTEIKAATYHQLQLKKSGSTWQAEIILDV
ncbi:MAG: archease [Candidatus Omnitrophica bacterium]|nr:archease [Candidatus Omnitrophota bacterium]MDD5592948.1 archease [Candidatus Omnitrophota bacterium]